MIGDQQRPHEERFAWSTFYPNDPAWRWQAEGEPVLLESGLLDPVTLEAVEAK